MKIKNVNTQNSNPQTLALAVASAWSRMERRLDGSLGAIRGISFAEYRLLRALADAPGARASRVDLAQRVDMTPSGVTRALRPMEKLGVVSTVRSKRDARLALAALTPAGREVLDDAEGVVRDAMAGMLERAPGLVEIADELVARLALLGR